MNVRLHKLRCASLAYHRPLLVMLHSVNTHPRIP